MSFRTASATQRNPVLKNLKKKVARLGCLCSPPRFAESADWKPRLQSSEVEMRQLISIFSPSLSENFAKDLEMFARWVEKLAV